MWAVTTYEIDALHRWLRRLNKIGLPRDDPRVFLAPLSAACTRVGRNEIR